MDKVKLTREEAVERMQAWQAARKIEGAKGATRGEAEVKADGVHTGLWKLAEEGAVPWLVGSYTFDSFMEAVAFAGRVAGVAEQLQHHPAILINYRQVQLRLTTHDVGGLTALDFKTMEAIEQLCNKAMSIQTD